jgi:hypothetical protein
MQREVGISQRPPAKPTAQQLADTFLSHPEFQAAFFAILEKEAARTEALPQLPRPLSSKTPAVRIQGSSDPPCLLRTKTPVARTRASPESPSVRPTKSPAAREGVLPTHQGNNKLHDFTNSENDVQHMGGIGVSNLTGHS